MNRAARHRRRNPPIRTALRLFTAAAGVAVVALVWDRTFANDSSASESTSNERAVDTTGRQSLTGAALPPVTVPAPVATRSTSQPKVPTAGGGRFSSAQGGSAVAGSGQLVTYRVEAEVGLPMSAAAFAEAVDQTLGDERGWVKRGYAFQRVPQAPLRIVLASPDTTDRLCHPLQTRGQVSCRSGNDVVINARRWVEGAESYSGDVERYRQYVINHEVGHSFGLSHRSCPAAGAKAPVMLQQTYGLQGCEANPWP